MLLCDLYLTWRYKLYGVYIAVAKVWLRACAGLYEENLPTKALQKPQLLEDYSPAWSAFLSGAKNDLVIDL